MAKIASTTTTNNSTRRTSTARSESRPLTASERREVEKLAYQFFIDRSYQHGNDQADWSRAEAIVHSRRS